MTTTTTTTPPSRPPSHPPCLAASLPLPFYFFPPSLIRFSSFARSDENLLFKFNVSRKPLIESVAESSFPRALCRCVQRTIAEIRKSASISTLALPTAPAPPTVVSLYSLTLNLLRLSVITARGFQTRAIIYSLLAKDIALAYDKTRIFQKDHLKIQ